MLAAKHKIRIKHQVRQLMPCSPVTGELGMDDLAVLGPVGRPARTLLAAGPTRPTKLIGTASHGQQGADRAEQWRQAAAAAVQLYDGHPRSRSPIWPPRCAPRSASFGHPGRAGRPRRR